MNNLHNSLRKMKNCNKERAGEKIFWISGWQKKSVHFFGKGYCKKCTGKEQ
jgi:hypothetical protein